MSTPTTETETQSGSEQDRRMSNLFASLIIQNTNMAWIFLGQAPNPQTGQTAQDLEHAQYFIDLLEMLALKTKGNLAKQEDALLKQSLTQLRLSFVEAVEHPPKPAPAAATPATPPTDEQETPVTEPVLPGEAGAESESRKKFSKKYD
jgi:hypothetical protein